MARRTLHVFKYIISFRAALSSNKSHKRSRRASYLLFQYTMVKPLAFKGDKKSKKRKHANPENNHDDGTSTAVTTTGTAAATAEEDDSWVTAETPTDITGPIILALPSTTPTCIACDANGKVFASELENIVEKDLATSEPHDVRQVWVANRVAGTESISFKGHHGR